MKIYYFQDPEGNFGDDMNAWIWDDLLSGWRGWRDDTTLIGIGTILNTQLPLPSGRKLVMGSGTGYGHLPALVPVSDWDVRAVRGPRSAERLNLTPDKGIVDPAMMLPRLQAFQELPKDGQRPVLVPHCSNAGRHDWNAICAAAGLTYVSPRADAYKVITEIARAPLVLAESMHAAIVADAFRTPWIAISISGTLNTPKWMDWADSLDIDLEITELFPELSAAMGHARNLRARLMGKAPGKAASDTTGRTGGTPRGGLKQLQLAVRYQIERAAITSRLRRAARMAPTLSDDARLADRQAAYAAMLETVRADYSLGGACAV